MDMPPKMPLCRCNIVPIETKEGRVRGNLVMCSYCAGLVAKDEFNIKINDKYFCNQPCVDRFNLLNPKEGSMNKEDNEKIREIHNAVMPKEKDNMEGMPTSMVISVRKNNLEKELEKGKQLLIQKQQELNNLCVNIQQIEGAIMALDELLGNKAKTNMHIHIGCDCGPK